MKISGKNKTSAKFMKLAIKEARRNIRTMDGGPFGACIVKGNKLLAVSRNKVLVSDATAHAEINAIRLASARIKSYDLSGCVIYSTTEPCPMCFSAIHWAKIEGVIYGTTISDARRIGFNELNISSAQMRRKGKSRVKLTGGFLRKECLELLDEWSALENKMLY
ncbi:MAG: nucleoside deaminase [Candidatus Omnitrophica bacterium]|nr:nucleoside deaminase [Candidatus Omnitrophota bacterium]